MLTVIGLTALADGACIAHVEHDGHVYDDVLEFANADDKDQAIMREGCHYNYQVQAWRDGHDHVHIVSNDSDAPFLFCGADSKTCYNKS